MPDADAAGRFCRAHPADARFDRVGLLDRFDADQHVHVRQRRLGAQLRPGDRREPSGSTTSFRTTPASPKKSRPTRRSTAGTPASWPICSTGMRSIHEGNGTLLDNSMILFGSSISDGDRHNPNNLPIILAGRGGHTIAHRPAPGQPQQHAAVQSLRLDARSDGHAGRAVRRQRPENCWIRPGNRACGAFHGAAAAGHTNPKRKRGIFVVGPSLALFDVALFRAILHCGSVFCGEAVADQLLKFDDPAWGF